MDDVPESADELAQPRKWDPIIPISEELRRAGLRRPVMSSVDDESRDIYAEVWLRSMCGKFDAWGEAGLRAVKRPDEIKAYRELLTPIRDATVELARALVQRKLLPEQMAEKTCHELDWRVLRWTELAQSQVQQACSRWFTDPEKALMSSTTVAKADDLICSLYESRVQAEARFAGRRDQEHWTCDDLRSPADREDRYSPADSASLEYVETRLGAFVSAATAAAVEPETLLDLVPRQAELLADVCNTKLKDLEDGGQESADPSRTSPGTQRKKWILDRVLAIMTEWEAASRIAFLKSFAPSPPAEGLSETEAIPRPKLNTKKIRDWMKQEGYDRKVLAKTLGVSERTIQSLLNNGAYHGWDAINRLANKMTCDSGDLLIDE